MAKLCGSSSIIGDAGPVWEDLVRSDELPCADKRVRGWRLGMHEGNSEYHGSNERKDSVALTLSAIRGSVAGA
jgi:hypothetical protein